MAPSRRGLSNEEILKLLNELSENDSCDENTSDDDENFVINDERTIVQNAHIISSSESSSSDSELNENKCSSVIHKKTMNCKSAEKKIQSKREKSLQSDLVEAKDGIIWKKRQQCSFSSGRRPIQNILKENPGPTPYSKRNIADDSPITSWRLFISDKMLNIIKKCTEVEARSKLNDETWSLSLDELDSFIAILYV